eukprot:PhM_4_TR8467/c5_g1_i2/m.47133
MASHPVRHTRPRLRNVFCGTEHFLKTSSDTSSSSSCVVITISGLGQQLQNGVYEIRVHVAGRGTPVLTSSPITIHSDTRTQNDGNSSHSSPSCYYSISIDSSSAVNVNEPFDVVITRREGTATAAVRLQLVFFDPASNAEHFITNVNTSNVFPASGDGIATVGHVRGCIITGDMVDNTQHRGELVLLRRDGGNDNCRRHVCARAAVVVDVVTHAPPRILIGPSMAPLPLRAVPGDAVPLEFALTTNEETHQEASTVWIWRVRRRTHALCQQRTCLAGVRPIRGVAYMSYQFTDDDVGTTVLFRATCARCMESAETRPVCVDSSDCAVDVLRLLKIEQVHRQLLVAEEEADIGTCRCGFNRRRQDNLLLLIKLFAFNVLQIPHEFTL